MKLVMLNNMFRHIKNDKSRNSPRFSNIKRIIEAHGGRILIDETYKGGAAFKFTLPLAN